MASPGLSATLLGSCVVKNELQLSDAAYAWVMAAFGVGSVVAALLYGKFSQAWRENAVLACAPVMLAALAAVAVMPQYGVLVVAWWCIGMTYSILGIRGSELLAANSDGAERSHIYAAHFALSHAGWGLTYPLAGFCTTALGFGTTAGIFAGLVGLVALLVRTGNVTKITP